VDISRRAAISTNKPLSRIILGSASPRRLELLRSLGLSVEVAASGYGEPDAPGLSPAELATNHAREKLQAVLRLRGDAELNVPILTADTVVDLDGRALGKPRDAVEAAGMLEQLSGREHLVHTAFALALPGHSEWAQERSTTLVRFYRLEPGEIAEYVATGEPLDKAGAYGIQGRASALVEAIDGDFYTVVGLPLARFVRALRRSGFALPKTN
jgi:septum formation protein